MDYYEELGVSPIASEDEIRRAHRRLTKLLHPDQQTDEGMKQLAETQMRRLNSIVEVLSDPEKRRAYDEQLRETRSLRPGALKRRPFRSWPWWMASTAGAIALTFGVVWLWADNWGSSFGSRTPTYISAGDTDTAAKPAAPAAAGKTADSGANGPAVAQPGSARQPADRPEVSTVPPSRTVTHVLSAAPSQVESKSVVVADLEPRKRTFELPPVVAPAAMPTARRVDMPSAPGVSSGVPSHVEASGIPIASLPDAPKPPEPPAPKAAKPEPVVKTQDSLEGEWVYAPTEPEKKMRGFYPPEFIDLKLFRNGGVLHGEYRARYRITDKPIPPDVAFTLSSNSNPRSFVWQSSNGSKGTLEISSIDASSIRINWRTTVFSSGPALTAGTAVLVRRTQ